MGSPARARVWAGAVRSRNCSTAGGGAQCGRPDDMTDRLLLPLVAFPVSSSSTPLPSSPPTGRDVPAMGPKRRRPGAPAPAPPPGPYRSKYDAGSLPPMPPPPFPPARPRPTASPPTRVRSRRRFAASPSAPCASSARAVRAPARAWTSAPSPRGSRTGPTPRASSPCWEGPRRAPSSPIATSSPRTRWATSR